jgi:hypothetical protein
MRKLLEAPLQSQVNHHARAGGLVRSAAIESFGPLPTQEIAVCQYRIRVGQYGPAGVKLARVGQYSGDASAVDLNAANGNACAELDT